MKIRRRVDFATFIKENKLNTNIAEIGVNNGDFSRYFVEQSNAANFYLIDPWGEEKKESIAIDKYGSQEEQNNRYKYVCDRFRDHSNVKIMRMTSVDASTKFEDGIFDFIYIDALHEYKYVKKDMEVWYPKLKNGGLFSGHDYKNQRYKKGLYRAVNEFAVENGKEVLKTSERCPSWYFFK